MTQAQENNIVNSENEVVEVTDTATVEGVLYDPLGKADFRLAEESSVIQQPVIDDTEPEPIVKRKLARVALNLLKSTKTEEFSKIIGLGKEDELYVYAGLITHQHLLRMVSGDMHKVVVVGMMDTIAEILEQPLDKNKHQDGLALGMKFLKPISYVYPDKEVTASDGVNKVTVKYKKGKEHDHWTIKVNTYSDDYLEQWEDTFVLRTPPTVEKEIEKTYEVLNAIIQSIKTYRAVK